MCAGSAPPPRRAAAAMPRAAALLAAWAPAAGAHSDPPPHLTHAGGLFPPHPDPPMTGDPCPSPYGCALPQYVEVPVDHFAASGGPTWNMRYYVNNASWKGDGAIFINMPGEGALGSPDSIFPNFPDTLCKRFRCLSVQREHRYFGASVPGGDATTAGMRFLSVEQNLADTAALVRHVRAQYAVPAASRVVALGGSYSGASSAWVRTAYPDLIDAAVAESGPVRAVIDFFAYDQTIAAALASPNSTCHDRMAATAAAMDREIARDMAALKRLFNASNLIGTPQGDVDFMYGLADSTASAVQYGTKEHLCGALARPYAGRQDAPGDDELLRNFANFTLGAYGGSYFAGCFYDSDCMRNTALEKGKARGARSWYWMKCSELAYLQTAPPTTAGPAMRPAGLTADALLGQCRYIYGDGLPGRPGVQRFNARFGGDDPRVANASRIVFLDYSDDPWHAASVTKTLSPDLPLLFTTCDGCAHCGSGIPDKTRKHLEKQKEKYLADWLGM